MVAISRVRSSGTSVPLSEGHVIRECLGGAHVAIGTKLPRPPGRLAFGLAFASATLLTTTCADTTSESLSSDERFLVCRAAIATIMHQPIGVVRASSAQNGMVRTSYKFEGARSSNLCRLDGDRVVWATIRNGGPGRWRNHELDPVVTFRLEATSITIANTYADGSSDSKTHAR